MLACLTYSAYLYKLMLIGMNEFLPVEKTS